MSQERKNIEGLDEALFGGVLGLSALIFSIKTSFLPENQWILVMLVSIYAIASMLRIFAIILESDWFSKACIFYCRIGLIPLSAWSFVSIAFTQIGLPFTGTFLSFYTLEAAELIILKKTYHIRIKLHNPFRNPISIERNGNTKSTEKKD